MWLLARILTEINNYHYDAALFFMGFFFVVFFYDAALDMFLHGIRHRQTQSGD